MNIMKRLLSITLALLMITAVLPAGVVAEVPTGWTVTATAGNNEFARLFDGVTTIGDDYRWTSSYGIGENQTYSSVSITINFGESKTLSSISLLSGSSDYAVAYNVSMSSGDDNWTTVASSTEGTVDENGYQTISLSSATGSQLKIECTQTNGGWHYWSIYELAISEDTSTGWSVSATIDNDNVGKIIDGDKTIDENHRWTSSHAIGYDDTNTGDSITINFGESISVYSIGLLSDEDYALAYTVYSSTDGYTWTAVTSSDSGSVTNKYQIISFETINTQYLKIECTKTHEYWRWWSIYELEINITASDVEEATLPSFYGWALTLDGRIGLTYYFDMTGVESPDSYTLTSNVGTVVKGESKTDGTGNTTEYYRYTVYVSVADINTTIRATLSNGDISVIADEYSVAAYCSTAIENEAAEKDLCQALLTYGYYTGEYIEGKSTGIIGYTDVSDNTVTIDSSKFGNTETSGYAKTLILDDVVSIRVYMTSEKCGESSTFKVGSNVLTPTAETKEVDNVTYSYYIEFDVSAQNLDAMFEICDKNGTFLTKYSVYSYIMNQLAEDSEASDSLKNLCKAIYMYGEAANSYNGWH
ncbi:MAG: discoidin domain-containing protein [Oscillospiraceae bacterium]|nr:discoidin domain-containing protein [Oscillospiraceae bacterium]